MSGDTSCAAQVRLQNIGIADAADPWRAGSESRLVADWLLASVLHDLRNPVGTIYAGAEMLMTHDTTPNEVKRLATNMYRAADRMRELLIDLASTTYGNRSTPELCDIGEIIVAALGGAFGSFGKPESSDLARYTRGNRVAGTPLPYEAHVFQSDYQRS